MKAIFACDINWGIGKNGDLPWEKNTEDLNWFKNMTQNSTVIMGRKTWESLPKKPLPQRHNIIVSNTLNNVCDENVEIVRLDIIRSRINFLKQRTKLWFIGGSQLFHLIVNKVDEIHISRIHGEYECDTFLDSKLINDYFKLIAESKNGNLHIETWERK